mmetsp:Transcript_70253/g.186702  ORF Transcript_70253/g.186702 Transcript_70253/m.186702 type:complete len:517 (-) Transcript_70253:243-1793(-)
MAGPPPPPSDRLFGVMSDGTGALTWGDLAVKRDRLAYALMKRLPESIVAGAVYSKNSVNWALCNQVCTAMGLRFSPINWHLVADEIAYIVDDSDADVVFFGAEYAPAVAAMRPKTPKVKAWVCMDGVVDGALSLAALVEEAPESPTLPPHNRNGGTVMYTGGTTGKPKGAVRDAASMQVSMEVRMAQLQSWGFLRLMPQPVVLVSAPLYHAMPSAWLGMGTALGATFVFMDKFDAGGAMAAIQRFKVNGFYSPPILLKRLLQVPEETRAKFDLSSVKTIQSSGAACPSSVKQGIVAVFGPVLHELYGASEIGGVATMGPEHMLQKPDSCGRPAAGIEVVILDENKQKIAKPGVAGDIYAKGFNIVGYHKQEEKTREAQFGDYFSVGDIGYFDEDGFLYISDRKIDMIVSGGVNIYPKQVEDVLQNHPDVEDVAVFAIKDSEYGERVHAALKLVPGRSVTASQVLKWCDGKIGKFQLPREADMSFHSEDFPRSDAGKLRKKTLREQVEARMPPQSRL